MDVMAVRRFLAMSGMMLAGLIGGCDTAPQMPLGAMPTVAPGMARVYVYRDATIYDSQLWSQVSLNGEAVGSSAPGKVFYRDVAPGTYRIEARSDKLYPEQAKTVVMAPGSATFVKVENLPFWGQSARQWQGTTFVVVIVDPAIGQVEVGRLLLMPG
jgi:hypothetical protein